MSKETKASKSITYLTDKQSSSIDITKVKSDTQIDDIVLQSNNSSIHTEPFADYTQQSLSLTTKKKPIEPLILSTHSSEFAYDKSQSSNSDCPTVDQLTNEVSYDDIKSQESSSNVVEKQRDNAEPLYNDNLGIHQMKLFVDELKGEFIKRFDQFHTQIKGVEQKIEHMDKRLNKKIDQLSQKIDNIYETNAT
ncbi:unnamed protein product [Rotaria socialis]|uniref:Uncharacterized protein n=1 Tax=Rotaria socialis TaxID=392032 RepID=A0A818BYE6_9BILA|nr:unnamed protein product [Rotaria socialis]CAF4679012.1 unnamed protein product [Rotaria socialis]